MDNMELYNRINNLRKSDVKDLVETRLKEFEGNSEWFSELCFCILTANSKAKSAIKIQEELGQKGFLEFSKEDVKRVIRNNNHRFHNNKTNYILEARKYSEIKEIIKGLEGKEAREWLVKNIKGLGYKEASHFLRNVGYKNLAILDRHILKLMFENGYIEEIPKTLTKNKYLDIENKFVDISKKLGMNVAELDMYMWFLKTGEVLK